MDGAQREGAERTTVQEKLPYWQIPWEFAVHAVVGTAVFAIIAVPAILLDLGVHKLEPYGISRVIILGLTSAEYGLLVTDLSLFGVFLWRTAERTVKNL
jgi:hypothetical protein